MRTDTTSPLVRSSLELNTSRRQQSRVSYSPAIQFNLSRQDLAGERNSENFRERLTRTRLPEAGHVEGSGDGADNELAVEAVTAAGRLKSEVKDE